MIYFIADTHFDDPNILIYSRPQFKTVEESNNTIITNWNNTVSPEDTVYHLGDVGNYEILKKLNGNIIVILGNHDNLADFQKSCPKIKVYDKPIFEDYMILSHEPIAFLPKEVPYLNIHGHLHQFNYRLGDSINWYDGNRYFNVSCENIDYTPISIEQIIKKIGYKKI